MSLIHYFVTQLSSNQFFNGTILSGALLGALYSLRSLPTKISLLITYKLMTKVTIDNKNDVYYWFNKSIEKMPFYNYKRTFFILSKLRRDYLDDGMSLSGPPTKKDDENRIIEYSAGPDSGVYIFKYKKKWIFLRMNKETQMQGPPLFTLSISYFGKSMKLFEELLAEAGELYTSSLKNKCMVYRNESYYGDWKEESGLEINQKSLDSVILPKEDREKIVNSLQDFLDNEKLYIDLGIPYHRTMLFYGAPGTGKTSLIHAIAGHFKLPIHYLMLQSITDEKAVSLFLSVPPKSLLVIEDIGNIYDGDKIFDNGSSHKAEVGPPNFNVFLNCLDGFCSKHGAITILTTNHFERLAPPILREGRIDFKFEFKKCNKYQIQVMAERFFKYKNMTNPIDRATAVASIIPEYFIAPSTLQSWLLKDNIQDIDTQLNYYRDRVATHESNT